MNAVIYARYSSLAQTEQSIEGQLRDCHAYAERYGLNVIGEYIDRHISGRSDDRPDFQRMIEDAKKRQFERIIVWKLDRFSRNRYDSAMYKYKLKQYGVKVISAMENIGEGDESILLEALLEASAEYFSQDLSKKVMRGMRESATKGASTGSFAPFGYKWENKRPVIDGERAGLVQGIFEQYARGVPNKDIIADLDAKGVRNARGGKISGTTLINMLSNPKYTGRGAWNGIDVEWPRLIDDNLFKAVQERIARNKRAPGAGRAKVDYLLSGKLFCGPCGSPMTGESGRGRAGTVYHYYACSARKKQHTCKKRNEKKDYIEWLVVENTKEYILQPSMIDFIAEQIEKIYKNEFGEQRIRELSQQVAKLEADIQKSFDEYLNAENQRIKALAQQRIDELGTQQDELTAELDRLKMAEGIRIKKETITAWLKSFIRGDTMDPEFRQKIIDVFINSVYLYDDKVVIFYNVQGSRETVYIDMSDIDDEVNDMGMVNVRISNNLGSQELKGPNTLIVIDGVFGCIFSR